MKKYIYMAVAAIAALSSCSSDNDPIMGETGKQALVFTATMEGSEGTRATYDSGNKCASWEEGDQISINGVNYSAQTAGTTTTFTATTEGQEVEGSTYEAYFPADLYDGVTATLPAIQTYKDGEFNMPMYATSTTTDLPFKNLCAVLAIKVTSDDIKQLKSIKVASDQKMNGSFTVTSTTDGGYKAVIDYDKGTNAVVLESSSALTLDNTGTTFYIAIPAQEYQYLNIFLSADGETYTQAMATKKVDGLGEIGRSKIFNIDYAKNATKMWDGNLFVADYNVGATSATDYGGYYTWGGTYENGDGKDWSDDHNTTNTGSGDLTSTEDTATKLWGSNWRMPKEAELKELLNDQNCTFTWTQNYNGTGVNGLLCKGKENTDYSENSVFLPAAGYYYHDSATFQGTVGRFWSSTPNGSDYAYYLIFNSGFKNVWDIETRGTGQSVRAVLEEAEIPAPAPAPAPATTGTAKATIGESEVDVNWVQLWENGPKFAEYNVYASSATNVGTKMYFIDAIKTGAEYVWGANWCTPSKDDMEELLKAASSTGSTKVSCEYTQVGDKWVFKFTGKETGYTDNSVFFPVEAGNSGRGGAFYWSSTADGSNAWYMDMSYGYVSGALCSEWVSCDQENKRYVRPVFKN